jgi:hypothetical protein
MASVRVHFSPGFPLGGGFPVEQFARWRRMFRRELLQRYSELRREGNFPGSKLSGFALVVFEVRRAPHVFLYSFAHFPIVMVRVATLLIYLTKNPPNRIPPEQKLLCGKSSSKRKSRSKVHPDGHNFEIIRV